MSDGAAAPRSWMLWAVAVAGIGVLAGVLILGLASSRLDQPGLRAFFIGWIVVPYVLSGLVAWWRRPASRLGPLMLLLGFTMALTPLQWSSQPLVHSIGHLFDMVPAAMFLHVFLAFPTGRLSRRTERWVVGSCYAITLGLQTDQDRLGGQPGQRLHGDRSTCGGERRRVGAAQFGRLLPAGRGGPAASPEAAAPDGPRDARPLSLVDTFSISLRHAGRAVHRGHLRSALCGDPES